MSELSQAIEQMRNMRENYDALATAAEAYNVGKPQLAASISAMGVPTNETDTLSEMATKVRSIPQQVNTRTSDFEQMIAPTPYMWNVYSVATDLMKETLPDYFPAYMAEYKQRYGANSLFVGEYYLGYDTLPLTGADGYLTCDGCFYTIAEIEGVNTVTRTAPDGTVTTYTADEIVHTWLGDSTYCNRWVAFFYLNSAYAFTNVTSSICPRRVALCGTCNSFIVSGENRLTDVWVIGTLGHFEGGTTGTTWNPAQVIRNYHAHSSGYIYYNPTNMVSCVLPDMEYMTSDPIYFGSNNSTLLVFLVPVNKSDTIKNLNVCSKAVGLVYTMLRYAETATTIGGVEGVVAPEGIFEIRGVKNIIAGGTINSTYKLFRERSSELRLPDLETVQANNSYVGSICGASGADGDIRNTKLKRIYIPNYKHGIAICKRRTSNQEFMGLADVEVGMCDASIDCNMWTASNLTSDPEQVALINKNIREHIAAKVVDRTGQDALTFTIGLNLFNNIEQATLDAFAAKNWNVAGV